MSRGKDWYHFPKGEYSPQFLKAVAMANHMGMLDPAELKYWFENNWTQREMTVALYNRVKPDTQRHFTAEEA